MSSWFDEDTLDAQRLGPVVDETLDRIAAAIGRDRMPRSLMLVGPPRLGRELAAVEAAAMMVCRDGGERGCSCHACVRVRKGLHPDVAVLRGEGKANVIKIDPIRDVVASAPGRPYEGQARVWILDGVERGRMTDAAANAFLKVLEEPPDHVRFILLAANPSAVIGTIRSRCQALALPGPVRVAELLPDVEGPAELAALGEEGAEAAAAVEAVREGLDEAFRGSSLGLLRAARRAGTSPSGLEAAALAAAELATEIGGEAGEGLSRLAEALVRAAEVTVALNLDPERQLVGCLMHWFEAELPGA